MAKQSSQDEKKWRAEMDADTMASYQEILQDKARMNAAIRVAKQRASDLTKRANAMTNVANTGKKKK